jgi:CHASE2 domain-containing sensor protein
MKEETKKKLLNVIRWITFLPASVLGAWLVYIIAYFGDKMLSRLYLGNSMIADCLIMFFAHAAMGGAFVLIGTAIAPKGKKIVAIVLLCITCVFCGVSLVFNIAQGFDWLNLVCMICVLVGAGYAFYECGENELFEET